MALDDARRGGEAPAVSFIDALPLCNSSETISRHLREYFTEASAAPAALGASGNALAAGAGLAGARAAGAAGSTPSAWRRGASSPAPISTKRSAPSRNCAARTHLHHGFAGEATITEAEAVRSQQRLPAIIEGLSRQVNVWEPVDLIDRDLHGPLPRVKCRSASSLTAS